MMKVLIDTDLLSCVPYFGRQVQVLWIRVRNGFQYHYCYCYCYCYYYCDYHYYYYYCYFYLFLLFTEYTEKPKDFG